MHARRSVRSGRALAALLLAGGLALTGCGAGDGSSSGSRGAADEAAGARPEGAGQGGPAARPSRAPSTVSASNVIRTASLTVRVKDVPEALDAARTTVEAAGGYVGSETTVRDGRGRERTRLVLRVPVAGYAGVLAGLEGSGTLLERSARAQDVTDQVVDVDSRISSQRASVARVRALMDRAAKLSDVVALEGELSSRQAELESLLARQASLKDRTGLATITLSLTETGVRKAAADDGPGFLDALAGGWSAFVTTVRWLAVAFGAALPFLVAAALLALLWLKVLRGRLPRRPEPVHAPVPGPPLPPVSAREGAGRD